MMRLVLPALLALLQSPPALADPPPALVLKPCRLQGVEQEARCGTLNRALDPVRPDGPRFDLHVAVLPALARNKHPDPVFFFAGGPGQSAVALAGSIQRLMARIANRRDIVLVDQRGTGRSAPLSCDDPAPTLPLRQLMDPAFAPAHIERCLQALAKLPHGDLRFYTTTLAMQDIDAVRAALGAERINLVGASYGTRAALEYQRQFPQRVRRAVLDGVAPPDMALTTSFGIDNEAALQSLLSACAQEPACARRHPELPQTLRRLLQGLPREATLTHPVTGVVETVKVDADIVLATLRMALYVPARAAAVPLAIEQAAAGRFDALLGLSMQQGSARKSLNLSLGMHYAVVCAEDQPRAAVAASAVPTFGDSFARGYARHCARLPAAPVPEAFYAIPAAPAPVLVLSGGIDPATPPRHGERVARALGAQARHVVVPQAGHGTLSLPCLRDVVFRFIDAADDSAAGRVDATCANGIPRPPAFAWPAAPAASEARS